MWEHLNLLLHSICLTDHLELLKSFRSLLVHHTHIFLRESVHGDGEMSSIVFFYKRIVFIYRSIVSGNDGFSSLIAVNLSQMLSR